MLTAGLVQKESIMNTYEEVRAVGLYASDCCDVELIFDERDTFCQCPQCEQLCGWDFVSGLSRLNTSLSGAHRYAQKSYRRHIRMVVCGRKDVSYTGSERNDFGFKEVL